MRYQFAVAELQSLNFGWQTFLCYNDLSNCRLVRCKTVPPHLMALHCYRDQLSMYEYDFACRCCHRPNNHLYNLAVEPSHFYQR